MAQEAESDCDDCTIHSEAWTGVCVRVNLVILYDTVSATFLSLSFVFYYENKFNKNI